MFCMNGSKRKNAGIGERGSGGAGTRQTFAFRNAKGEKSI